MNTLPSIVARVSRALLLWALLWGAAVTLAVFLAVQNEVDELLDDTLQAAAAGLIAPLLQGAVEPAGGAVRDVPEGLPASGRFVWQLVGFEGSARVLRASNAAPLEPLRGAALEGFADVPGWRVYGMPVAHAGRLLLVAQTREERGEARLEVALAVALASLPMAILALVWLRGRLRHELAPLQELSRRLQGHDPMAPGATLGAASRQEFASVHAAVNSLTQRLLQRVTHERAVAAHAAHALRTPLAGIDAQLAVALREAPATLQPRLQRVRVAAGRLQRVVAALISLFRSGVELQRETLDLPAMLARVPVDELAVEVRSTHSVQGDADLVTAALMNLLDNAVRHGARRLTLSTPAPQVLRVDDDGPGVDEARRLALQQALDAQDGASDVGLGLMLAQLVARAHGGALELPAAARGFAVVLRLGPAPASAQKRIDAL